MHDALILSLIFGSAAAAFGVFVALTPSFTHFLYRNQLGKKLREPVEPEKLSILSSFARAKAGTPTMAGMLVIASVLVTLGLAWAAIRFLPELAPIEAVWPRVRGQIYLPLFTLLAAGALGMIDDYFHLRPRGRQIGLGRGPKMLWLLVFAAVGAWWFFTKLDWTVIHLPRLGDFDIGIWYVPLFMLVFWLTPLAVAASDGFDGLLGGLLTFAFAAFATIAFAKGLVLLAMFCAVLGGATLGFLWFNLAPARFLLGNVGALGLGATLGVIALLTNSAAVLPIVGFVFFLELGSIVVQRLSVTLRRGEKVFLRAPLHAHFEQLGWPEARVVARFWIIGALAAGLGAVIGVLGMGS